MKLQWNELVTRLKEQGLSFRHYVVSTEGKYTPEDAIWNYKDALVHIPHIHGLVRNTPILNHRDSLASVFVQKILGMRFPMLVFDYEATPFTQTAVTTLFFFVLVIHNVCEEVRPGVTRVTTNYHIGANRLFRWAIGVVGWALKKNYRALTATDIPLRERRGELRAWGYDFLISDYLTTESLARKNWRRSEAILAPVPQVIRLSEIRDGEPFLIGRSDHYGLRLTRSGQTLLIHPRMCPHEGAELDKAAEREGCLTCPWHGRKLAPLGKLDLALGGHSQEFAGEYHRLTYRDGALTVYYTSIEKGGHA